MHAEYAHEGLDGPIVRENDNNNRLLLHEQTEITLLQRGLQN